MSHSVDSTGRHGANLLAEVAPIAARMEGVVFDCDGTLADTLPLHFLAWKATLAQIGVEMPATWYFERVGLSSPELVRDMAIEFGVSADHAALVATQADHFLELVPDVGPIGPVIEVVQALRGRVSLAVSSGGPRRTVAATLEALGLVDHFDAVVTLDDVRRGKPAPDLYLEAARRLGVPAARCLAFDDTDEGIAAAQAAGMTAVDVRPFR